MTAPKPQWWLIYGAGTPGEPLGVHLVEAIDQEEALRNYYVFGLLVRFDTPPVATQPASWAVGPFDSPEKTLALEPVWARDRALNLLSNSLAVRSPRGISSQAEEAAGSPCVAAYSPVISQSLSC